MKKTPLLIFDFDGTLADTLTIFVEAYNEVAPKFHLAQISPEERLELQKQNVRDVIQRLKVKAWQLPFLILRIKRVMRREQNAMQLFPGIREVLLSAHTSGIEMGILSSNRANIIRHVMRLHGVEQCFRFILSERNLYGKDRYLGYLRRKYRNHEIWYVGDQVSDMEDSRRAKVRNIAVPWGFNTADAMKKTMPDVIVQTPQEIIDAVNSSR